MPEANWGWVWSGRPGSNWRPPGPKPGTLPLRYAPMCGVFAEVNLERYARRSRKDTLSMIRPTLPFDKRIFQLWRPAKPQEATTVKRWAARAPLSYCLTFDVSSMKACNVELQSPLHPRVHRVPVGRLLVGLAYPEHRILGKGLAYDLHPNRQAGVRESTRHRKRR